MKTRMSSLILLVPMLALFIARSCLATTAVQFAAATNCNVGVNPVSIAIADFNRDGHLDIATANDSTGNLTILLGDGQGGFTVKTNYPIGTVPQGVATGDFNGDGIPDLIVTRAYGNQAIILQGLGDGNFAPATYQALGASAADGTILVGDFNNDNKLDFIAAFHNVGFSVSLGAGDGTFATANVKNLTSTETANWMWRSPTKSANVSAFYWAMATGHSARPPITVLFPCRPPVCPGWWRSRTSIVTGSWTSWSLNKRAPTALASCSATAMAVSRPRRITPSAPAPPPSPSAT
jgi:hypothetical protein